MSLPKNLLILESPGKVRKVQKIVGKEYLVVATVGHCIDLPVTKLGINIKKQFEPEFVISDGKEKIVSNILKLAKKVDSIYMMTDPDREGSGIAANIWSHLKNNGVTANMVRATTNEITEKGILHAIKNPGELDTNIVNAYLCRRLLDRLCGYKTSYLTHQATGGRSAGRVQSAILRIIVDREKGITHFIPKEFWVLIAHLISSKNQPYEARLNEKIKVPNEKTATEIYNKVLNGLPFVSHIDIKQVNIKPFAPFTTIPMQGTAATVLGWNASRTMKVAQNLYQNGLISYHRSDSPSMSKEATSMIRDFIEYSYGSSYLPNKPPFYVAKKGAQEAHECCRIIDVDAQPHLDGDEDKLYQLIWKRTVSSQMTPGIDERMKVVTEISGYDFISKGNRIMFDGFRKCWNVGKSKTKLLPELNIGEKCSLDSLSKDQKWTLPPSRYSVASLGKECENKQIARPATFSNFLDVLKNRKYIIKKNSSFQPTELGVKVIDFLVEADFCFVDVQFTTHLEEKLDSIQAGKNNVTETLSDFWKRLKKDIANGRIIKKQQEISIYICPKCQGKLLLKHSKFGPFFACQNYKPPKKANGKKIPQSGSCTYIAKVGEKGEPVETVIKTKEYAKFKCKKCGSKMVKRTSKKGEQFYGCENFSKSGCRCTASLDGEFSVPKAKKWKKKK